MESLEERVSEETGFEYGDDARYGKEGEIEMRSSRLETGRSSAGRRGDCLMACWI